MVVRLHCQQKTLMKHLALVGTLALVVLTLAPPAVEAVKRADFKTCAQSSFCRRHRAWADLHVNATTAAASVADSILAANGDRAEQHAALTRNRPIISSGDVVADAPRYALVPGSIDASRVDEGIWSARVSVPSIPTAASRSSVKEHDLALTITTLVNGAARVQLTNPSTAPAAYAYDPTSAAFSGTPIAVPLVAGMVSAAAADSPPGASTAISILSFGDNQNFSAEGWSVRVRHDPLRISLVVGLEERAVVNGRGWLRVETGGSVSAAAPIGSAEEGADKTDPWDAWRAVDRDGTGPEEFNGHQDRKPHGDHSFGLDVSFPGAAHAYGLAEHATDFDLPSTRGDGARYSDPYRLYNLDVFEYELDNPMALYGSVPLLLTHGAQGSAGALVLTASETWVDIDRSTPKALGSHWMAETMPADIYLFAGASIADTHAQYMALSGYPTLPPTFATAYHHCRWNFNDEPDVRGIDAGMDVHGIPCDVVWLDIEHTDGKRYLTWDAQKFPDPARMIGDLASKGRKMVTIVDPHIKVDVDYAVSREAKAKGLMVRDREGKEAFSGWCWPGDSNWIDFVDPVARDWWSGMFAVDKYKGSTTDLYTWNDMNEPSVFTGPEITMHKDLIHHGHLEHRAVHNAYGMLQHKSTHLGHLRRTAGNPTTRKPSDLATIQRPFVLSRAFFVGTQRYGAVWTGDNMANWEHLRASVPMLLQLGMSGIVFGGADVGGFFGNVEPELLVRWYQVGALQPFFRAHAHIDTKRREPWLFDDTTKDRIRAAIQRRYRLLPTLSTLFDAAWRTGAPIMRPLAYEFPTDPATWSSDSAFMLGPSILVAPVTQPAATSITTYLPKGADWFGVSANEQDPAAWTFSKGGNTVTVEAPLEAIPVWYRAGSVVVTRERAVARRSSAASARDPLTLYVMLSPTNDARDTLVVDDGNTFAHLAGRAVAVQIKAAGGGISAALGAPAIPRALAVDATGDDAQWVSQQRNVPADPAVVKEFVDSMVRVRVERVVVVAPPDVKVQWLESEKVVKVKGANAVVVKEPGWTLGDATWAPVRFAA
ncbi:glycosyl hydrolases family 31-domain-containing protein [Blastocladiella britannica]|nr:glycosyl hydrolases family 31-domain-containing protein [Blastocladiella britannica]